MLIIEWIGVILAVSGALLLATRCDILGYWLMLVSCFVLGYHALINELFALLTMQCIFGIINTIGLHKRYTTSKKV